MIPSFDVPMADRPISVHVRAASLVWKKLKLAGLNKDYAREAYGADKENAPRSTIRSVDYDAMRDLDKYMKLVGNVIPNHPSYRRRKEDTDIKELEVRERLRLASVFLWQATQSSVF